MRGRTVDKPVGQEALAVSEDELLELEVEAAAELDELSELLGAADSLALDFDRLSVR